MRPKPHPVLVSVDHTNGSGGNAVMEPERSQSGNEAGQQSNDTKFQFRNPGSRDYTIEEMMEIRQDMIRRNILQPSAHQRKELYHSIMPHPVAIIDPGQEDRAKSSSSFANRSRVDKKQSINPSYSDMVASRNKSLGSSPNTSIASSSATWDQFSSSQSVSAQARHGGQGAMSHPQEVSVPTNLVSAAYTNWYYLDSSGVEQGPFDGVRMQEWYSGQWLQESLFIRRSQETEFYTIREFIIKVGDYLEPFLIPQFVPQVVTQVAPGLVTPESINWVYRDTNGIEQGPFDGVRMQEWYSMEWLQNSLLIRRVEEPKYYPLKDFVHEVGDFAEPFLVPQPFLSRKAFLEDTQRLHEEIAARQREALRLQELQIAALQQQQQNGWAMRTAREAQSGDVSGRKVSVPSEPEEGLGKEVMQGRSNPMLPESDTSEQSFSPPTDTEAYSGKKVNNLNIGVTEPKVKTTTTPLAPWANQTKIKPKVALSLKEIQESEVAAATRKTQPEVVNHEQQKDEVDDQAQSPSKVYGAKDSNAKPKQATRHSSSSTNYGQSTRAKVGAKGLIGADGSSKDSLLTGSAINAPGSVDDESPHHDRAVQSSFTTVSNASTEGTSKTTTISSSTTGTACHEFINWCKHSLQSLEPGVNQTELLTMLVSLPVSMPESKEIIAESIYSSSTTMDGRRFANEFITRHKQVEFDDKGQERKGGESGAVAVLLSEIIKKEGLSCGLPEGSAVEDGASKKMVNKEEDGWEVNIKKKGRT